MTRQERIEVLKDLWRYEHSEFSEKDIREALDMAIKALEQEPCEDCVSRQAVDELSKALVHTTRDKADFLCNFWEGLRKLPPVTPQQKTGRWIAQDIHNCHTAFKCSECGYIYSFTHLYGKPKADYNYCPNCGAKMEGGQNGN